MTTPHNADAMRRTTSKGRVYTWQGRNYWSVTTIIKGGLPAPALMAWGMRTVAEHAVKQRQRMWAMCEAAAGDPEAEASVVNWLKNLPYRERERAADLGTLVHRWTEAHGLGQPIPEPPAEVAPFLAQFQKFNDDFHPEYVPEMVEAPVFNVTESYAGTLDAIGRIGNKLLLIDYKTGKDVYAEAALQLAAYSHAEFVGMPDGTEHEMPRVDGAAVLHLRPEGYALRPVRIDEDVYKAFLYCREVFRFQEDIAKTCVSEPLLSPAGVDFLYPEEAA